MLHLFDQVREPIDAFEQVILNAFSTDANVEGLWVREVRTAKPHINGLGPGAPRPKRFTRVLFIQLHRKSLGSERQIKTIADELCTRALREPFELEVRILIDDLPPASIAPSCIYRRRPTPVD